VINRVVSSSIILAILGAQAAMKAQQVPHDHLERAFLDPPSSARPRVWWHWMNGNITAEGIRLDLAWMQRAGVGGFTVFEGSIDTPQVVEKRLIYMTPDWKQAFQVALSEAQRLKLEMTIASSAGWSETGGPWVQPGQGMKKLVWASTIVEGGKPYHNLLPSPPSVSGPFQNVSLGARVAQSGALPTFYADSVVLAYPLQPSRLKARAVPRITAEKGEVDAAALSDDDIAKVAATLPYAPAGQSTCLLYSYAQPSSVQSVTLASLDDVISIFGFDDPGIPEPQLEASQDGLTYEMVARIPPSSIPQRTVTFPSVTARDFRVCFPSRAGTTPNSSTHQITELTLNPEARVNDGEQRAGFATVRDYDALTMPAATADSIVPSAKVLDITNRMAVDGTLTWTPPPGSWVVLRMGYSLTGHENGPAPAEATGLEVDKLDAQAVHAYLEHYLKLYQDTVGEANMGANGVAGVQSDSTETGVQNWTGNVLVEFKARRGYDPHPWLPALTGVIIESSEKTTKFLWDFRRTLAELLAQNHYGQIASTLHRKHMFYAAEALEYHRPTLGDDMEMRRNADIPMGALWTFEPGEQPSPTYIADVRGAASVAHVYGQNLVGAESMTSNGPAWGWSPEKLKPIADYELALGVNRFMIHESAHQPLVGKTPGLTLGPYGLWFNRNETWAELAKPWTDYLARSCYLLQQGRFYADIAYFYGQEAPLTAFFGYKPQTDAPEGYGFDFVNADVVLHHFKVQNGQLRTPAGASYRLLYLGGSSAHMTLAMVNKLAKLVAAGAAIAGTKPVDSPSLSDDAAHFQTAVDALWGAGNRVHRYGKGIVYAGQSAETTMQSLHVAKDFAYTRPRADTELMFVHRRLPTSDVYFISHRNDQAENVEVTLRTSGRMPELWHADTGRIDAVSYRAANGSTTLSLHLLPHEAVFVLFRKSAGVASTVIPTPEEHVLGQLKDDWLVAFQPGRGVSKSQQISHLASWTESSDAGVRYFSGTAEYTQSFGVPQYPADGRKLLLDLGSVAEIAEVTVNGRSLGIGWKAPYRFDITDAVHPGENHLSIKVTNLWVNRLIGDQQPGIGPKYTFTTFKPYKKDSPLIPSGLLGPVTLLTMQRQSLR
jgi:hypothetical protein